MRWIRDRLNDLQLAIMLLTRLPVGIIPRGSSFGRAVWAYPLVGALVGALCGGAFALAARAGLSSVPTAALALAVGALVTGCLHEDGLADFADGLGGGRDRARKLEIMRDSRIGTYGVMALILVMALRWSAIAALAGPVKIALVWIAAGALSRGAIALPLWLLSPARADGLGAQAASPPFWSVAGAGVVALAVAVAALGMRALPLLGIALVSASIVTALARRHLQGHTGDVLGACALVSETACLLLAGAGWF